MSKGCLKIERGLLNFVGATVVKSAVVGYGKEINTHVFIPLPKVGKMQHGLNVSERYVRHGFLASVRRSEFGKVLFGPFGYEYFAFADLGRGVLPPRRGSAGP